MKLEDTGLDKYSKITNIANLSPIYCLESDNMKIAINRMVQSAHRRLPITNKSMQLSGIITYTDILDSLMRGLTPNTQLATFMIKGVISCDKNDTIKEVLQKLKISKRGGMPVVSNKKLIGMVSERDFVKVFYNRKISIPVKDVMTRKPFYLPPNVSISNCIKSIINTRYRRLPIAEHKRIVGIVTALDVLHYLDRINYNTFYLNEPVETIMKPAVFSVSENDDLSDAIKVMIENNIGGLLVANGDILQGIITERDILERIE